MRAKSARKGFRIVILPGIGIRRFYDGAAPRSRQFRDAAGGGMAFGGEAD
jgi:hypothetical protein